jgi:hypothetical protein
MAPLFLFSLRVFHLLVCANYLKYHKGTNGPLTKPTFFYHNYSNSLLYYNQCICNSKNVFFFTAISLFSCLCSRCLCTCHVSLSGKFLIKVCAPAGNETVKLPSPPAPAASLPDPHQCHCESYLKRWLYWTPFPRWRKTTSTDLAKVDC